MPDPVTITDPNHPGIQLMTTLTADIRESGVPHGTVLDVLLCMYVALAEQFPCCHEGNLLGLEMVRDRIHKARAAEHYTKQAALAAIERAATHGPH